MPKEVVDVIWGYVIGLLVIPLFIRLHDCLNFDASCVQNAPVLTNFGI